MRKRSYKTFDEGEFREAVKKIRWYEIYSCQDVDLAVDALTTKLTEILDVMSPVKTFQVRKKYAAWVSSDTKEKMKARDAAQVRAATTQLKEDWELYRRVRNDLVVVKRKEKLAWQQQKLENCEESGDHGKLWKNVLGWLNWSSSIAPTKLSKDGALETSPSKMAEIQNEYYINKVRTIRQSMPPQRRHPLHTLRQSMQNRAIPFSLDPVSPDQVDKIISSLKNSKACGVDMVDTYILKLVKSKIVPSVCHIVNLSFQQSKFPTKWKVAKVIPLYKGKGCKLEPKQYRSLSKVLERCVSLQVLRHMDNNSYLNPNHHAYRASHSTTTALVQMYDTWLEALEEGELAGVCMVDMSAAFDLVDIDILLQKLKLYRFDQILYSELEASLHTYHRGCI